MVLDGHRGQGEGKPAAATVDFRPGVSARSAPHEIGSSYKLTFAGEAGATPLRRLARAAAEGAMRRYSQLT
jgi:hypothetical protein